MGVRGLTTYINNHEDLFLKQHLLHDSYIVIDGHSLCAQLYASLNCFSAFGGDYDKFASYTKKFFQQLVRCKITCFVLFDGGYENRKLKTAHQRLKSKIYGASRLDPVTQSTLRIFPILLRDVFKYVLSDLQIPYSICEFEADDEIAALARHLNCPVLSYDSDFFIYNVLYIPFNTLDFKPVPIEEDDKRFYALECKIYKMENLLDHFGGLKEEMLPLLATLLGNDFVEKRVFKNFFSQLKLPNIKKKTNDQQRSIHGLLKWLRGETLDSAIEKILGRLRKNKKRIVFIIIKKSIEGYNRKYCRSLKYFNLECTDENVESILKVSEDNLELDSDDETSSNESQESSTDNDDKNNNNDNFTIDVPELPDWAVEGIRKSFIPQSYINLFIHHLYFCSPQAEDYNQEDAFLCTLPVLRYAFDILTDFSIENCTYVSRDKENYRRVTIGKEYGVSQPYDACNSLMTDPDKLIGCFYHFLKEKFPNLALSAIDLLPENYRLIMLSVLWWVTNCHVTSAHVYSLFLCYIMLEVIDDKIGQFRNHNYFLNKHAKKLEELKRRPLTATDVSELYLNKNKVLYEDCLLAANVLLLYLDLDAEIRKRPKTYDRRRVHTFAQFQCCLQQFSFLNILCRSPYYPIKYFNSYNGSFLYNISKKLENQSDPFLYVEQMLKGADTVLLFYKSLCKVYDECVSQLGVVVPKSIGKKRGRRKKNANKSYFLDGEFESEVII